MQLGTRKENLSFIVQKLLNQLDIESPTEKQILNMKNLLMDKGFIVFQQHYDERLSQAEIACLYLIANGKTWREIAKELGIKPNTVKEYQTRIKRKLDCKTIAAAVHKGVQYGFLLPKFLHIKEKSSK